MDTVRGACLNERKHGRFTEQFTVSAYVGSSKDLKHLKIHGVGSLDLWFISAEYSEEEEAERCKTKSQPLLRREMRAVGLIIEQDGGRGWLNVSVGGG